MTKQWGHGFHTGQNKARLSARDAAEQLRSPEPARRPIERRVRAHGATKKGIRWNN